MFNATRCCGITLSMRSGLSRTIPGSQSPLLIPIHTYIITAIKSTLTVRSAKVSEQPIMPYFIPFLGNLLPFLFSVSNFASSITRSFGFTIPVRIRLGPFKAYIVHSAAHYDTFLARRQGSKDRICRDIDPPPLIQTASISQQVLLGRRLWDSPHPASWLQDSTR